MVDINYCHSDFVAIWARNGIRGKSPLRYARGLSYHFRQSRFCLHLFYGIGDCAALASATISHLGCADLYDTYSSLLEWDIKPELLGKRYFRFAWHDAVLQQCELHYRISSPSSSSSVFVFCIARWDFSLRIKSLISLSRTFISSGGP